MTEQAAKALAATIGCEAVRLMPGTRSWGIVVVRADGRIAAIEDHAGSVYHSRSAFDAWHRDGNQDGIERAVEWGEWSGGEEWAKGLSGVLGSNEYWHSGGGIWLVFYPRRDGRFAVIGGESGAVYACREEFEADECGEKAENHVFV